MRQFARERYTPGMLMPLKRAVWNTVVRLFHTRLYETHPRIDPRWMGVKIQKMPFDCWVYQEILHECRPDVLIETGTYNGGSTLFYAHMFDLLGHGEVLSIDLEPQADLPQHPRISYLTASSTSPEALAWIAERIEGKKVMVVLDSDHSEKHVRAELEALAPLVSPGQYLVVEDTNINGHPVYPSFGPGPMEALDEWLKTNPPFDADPAREKFYFSYFPRGFWRRR